MSVNDSRPDVLEQNTEIRQPVPTTQPATVPVPLDRVLASIASDSLSHAKDYLKSTVTPGGGE